METITQTRRDVTTPGRHTLKRKRRTQNKFSRDLRADVMYAVKEAELLEIRVGARLTHAWLHPGVKTFDAELTMFQTRWVQSSVSQSALLNPWSGWRTSSAASCYNSLLCSSSPDPGLQNHIHFCVGMRK